MRLDGITAPTVVGLSLSAFLLAPQSTNVNGFPLSGHGVSKIAASKSTRCHNQQQLQQNSLHQTFLSKNIELHREHISVQTRLSSQSSSDDIIDAIVEDKTAGLELNDGENTSAKERSKERKRDVFKKALGNLASLSLIDYKWRSALFKKNEADRMEEEWMSAMMGEDPSYARPMDAGDERRGPLGNAEKSAVQWLQSVIEEEGKRARRIAESNGELIRPKDLSPKDEAGPLSELERRALQFISEITDSEVERVRKGTMRPKDMETLGPLGEAEARAVVALDKIVESEKLRMDQSRMRGGEVVRPIDVPGPLGEFERYVGDIIRAERQRVKDREANEGKLVRPKDSSLRSGLGEVERKAVEDWEKLTMEEKERLLSLRRYVEERRPLETNPNGPLGVTEAFTVGLFRGPKLLGKVVGRVKELLSSVVLDGQDQDVVEKGLPTSSESEVESSSEGKSDGETPQSKGDDIVLP